MYLKRLELQGFKSFADKTVLDFGGGVTSVVGPNGSGKSNISDAIRWVMGEMSAKSLRGANMQDVIFAGTESRKQVNFAEVSLVLDNSSRIFPIVFDEVVVTRRVMRSGESTYQINRANCRLKDIHELFMDTGLGRDGYSIIGQGNVSKILSTKAEDRRSFFEEAAGVSKYKHRKDEAERKLAGVHENLVRINDITLELERQLGPLENQSKKARKYIELYDEYKGLDVSMSLINLEKNDTETDKCRELYQSIDSEIDELRGKETDIEKKRNSLYEKSKLKDEEHAAKNNELIENEAKLAAEAKDISIAENDIKNNEAMEERIKKEIVEAEGKIEEIKTRISVAEKEIAEKETESRELVEGFGKIQDENEEIFAKLTATRKEIDEINANVIEKMNSVASKKADMSGMEALRRSFIERREAVEAELKNSDENAGNTASEIEKDKAELAKSEEKLQAMQERVSAQESRKADLTRKISDAKSELADSQLLFNSKHSKKRMLEDMENEYDGFYRSVKLVLKAPELKKNMIYGTVSGLIEVADEYVVAIEAALGGALQNIVVETEEDAKSAIEYLRKNKGGRATFLPISSVSGKSLDGEKEIEKENGFAGIASKLVKFDKKYDGIIKSLLGRVVVFDNIDNAISFSKRNGYRYKVVTKDGDILNPGGSISGGSVNKSSGILSRANEIKKLEREVAELNSKINGLKEKLTKFEEELSGAEMQLASYLPLMRDYENDILILKNTIEHLEESLKNSGESEKTLHSELAEIEKHLSESSEDVAKLINDIRREENEITAMTEKSAELEESYSDISAEKDEKSKELMDETLRLRTIEKDISALKNSIAELNTEIGNTKQGIGEKNADIAGYRNKNSALLLSIQESNARIEALKLNSENIKAEIARIDDEKEGIVEGLKGIQTENKDLTDKMLLLQQELSKAENKLTKLEMEAESLINRLWNSYELTRTSAQEVAMVIENVKEASERAEELHRKIKHLGSVNVDAIEEYKAAKERYDFLSTQKTDLEKSQDNLNKVIASVQELMEEHFRKNFEEINKSFSNVFKELFGGGRGRLYLSDPDDIMESGIEIEVQLPGKGLQNINLYSGGEKSFIAIALLFAILEVKPTPFCILDEIDAALDDVNVSRFATYLKNYLAKTQFIVITHRRGTMEASNIMYGVTMQEKGVSKLLSLNIDEVTEEIVGLG